MTESKLIQHNYSEDEVWDLLTRYLERQHQATKTSIQKGIYADFHSEGSIFLVDECEDEFATLYCFRNLNFNIYGSIIYQLDSQYSEDFTLESICEFLGEPFPKVDNNVELTEEEIEEKNIRIRLNTQARLNLEQRDQAELTKRYSAISLLYAFEYHRAEGLNDRSYHMGQHTKDPSSSSFVLTKQLHHIDSIRVISPQIPDIQELMNFLNSKKHLADHFGVNFDDIIEIASTLFEQKYESFFSSQARRVGSLLYPMHTVTGELVSALNIIDIKDTNNDKEFLLIKNEANTIGSIQHFNKDTDNVQIIFITEKLTTADTLKTLFKNHPVHACLSPKNVIKVLNELSDEYPDSFILVVLDNEYISFIKDPNPSRFYKSTMVKLAQHLKDNPESLPNIGTIYTRPEPSQQSHANLYDLYHNIDKDEAKALIQAEISAFVERYQEGKHELNHLVDQHNEYAKIISEKFRSSLPKLILDTSSNPHQNNPTPLEKPTVFDTAPNSVLFKEKQTGFSEWLRQPPTEAFVNETKAMDEAWVKFNLSAVKEKPNSDLESDS